MYLDRDDNQNIAGLTFKAGSFFRWDANNYLRDIEHPRVVISSKFIGTCSARFITESSQRKIRHYIRTMNEFAIEKQTDWGKDGKIRRYKLIFVTLTLPALQFHTDSTLKKKALNQFLTIMRQKKGMKNYLWRAEVQENGSLHFHLVTDTLLHWSVIRKSWNSALKKLGYIDRYRENRENEGMWQYVSNCMAREGLKFCESVRRWNKGKNSNWSDPSTIEVRGVKNDKQVNYYISKYVSKTGEKRASGESYELSERRIEGIKWGASQSLSKVGTVMDIMSDELLELFYRMEQERNIYHYQLEGTTGIIFNRSKLSKDMRLEVSRMYNKMMDDAGYVPDSRHGLKVVKGLVS